MEEPDAAAMLMALAKREPDSSRVDKRLSVSFLLNSGGDINHNHSPEVGQKRKNCNFSDTQAHYGSDNDDDLALKKQKIEFQQLQDHHQQHMPSAHDQQQHAQLVLKLWHRQQQVQKIQYLYKKKQEKQMARAKQVQERDATKKPACTAPSKANTVSLVNDQITEGTAETPQALEAMVEEWIQEANRIRFNPGKEDKRRKKIAPHQVYVLDKLFAQEPFPSLEMKKLLAKSLGMCERSITVWFQNKRARLKRMEDNEKKGAKKEEITFHNLTVGNDGKLEMMPEFRV